TDPILGAEVRIGVLMGSVASAVVGFQLLRRLAEIEELKRQTRETARF
ncbi:MAG: hypothetical protein ACK4TP_07685, partial [Hyphomicrobium sp.]